VTIEKIKEKTELRPMDSLFVFVKTNTKGRTATNMCTIQQCC